jgi:hypothetical protein
MRRWIVAVYAYAAMLIFSRRMNPGTMWQQLAQELEDGKKPALRSKKQPAPGAASGFVSNW